MIASAWTDAQVIKMLAISKGHLRLLLARSKAAGLPFPGADLGGDGRALRRWNPDLAGLLRWASEVQRWQASKDETAASPCVGVRPVANDVPRLTLLPKRGRSAPSLKAAEVTPKATPVLQALQLVRRATSGEEPR